MENINEFLEFLRRKATKLQDDAGYNGRHDDGGASHIRDMIDVYIAGMSQQLPENWKRYYEEFQKEGDPEYQEYLRLKNKFK